MESIVDPLGQLGVDAVHAGQILDTSPRELFQAAKLPEEGLAALGADTGNAFEDGYHTGFGPALAMSGNSEAMGLITNLLHQMQGG